MDFESTVEFLESKNLPAYVIDIIKGNYTYFEHGSERCKRLQQRDEYHNLVSRDGWLDTKLAGFITLPVVF